MTKDLIKKYDALIEKKKRRPVHVGFDVDELNPMLFPFQDWLVRWALRVGRAALFAECGLGKTPMQLEWAHRVHKHTDGDALILCPLAVAAQTVREGQKFGIEVTHCRRQEDVRRGINIVNYERLDGFDASQFSAVILDESSILKSFDGSTKTMLCEMFDRTPFKLACTATPAPNDFDELGQHSEFLGWLSAAQMRATWFINDTSETAAAWRLKGHAKKDFWRWVATWGACVGKPSDIGFPDEGYDLPKLHMKQHVVSVDYTESRGEDLFRVADLSATNIHREMRITTPARVASAAALVNESREPWVVWCNTNYEADELKAAIPDGLEVRGNDSADYKETASEWFRGEICECELKRRGFGNKLAACGSLSMPRIAEVSITQTPNIERPEKSRVSAIRDMGSNTTEPTRQSGREPQSSERRSTQDAENFTVSNPKEGSPPKQQASNGSNKTLEKGKPSDFVSLDSPLTNLNGCSAINAADAQSAEATKTSRLLTIATQPEKFADCFATGAITGSESSKTAKNFSIEPSCICGGIKSRRILLSKPSIFGYGLNFQHCARSVFVGLSYSFESLYQAIRRTWRFGQTREVECHIVTAESEGAIVQTIQRKISQHDAMKTEMQSASKELSIPEKRKTRRVIDHTRAEGKNWTLYHGDCVRGVATLPDSSVHLSVFSPPFVDLFTYSDDEQDMGNCNGLEEFMEAFHMLVDELHRVTMPGRLCAVHCLDLMSSKWKDGEIGLKNFSGEIVDAFMERGWLFHSRVTIWKDPVVEMQRTKALGLLHKQLKKDSAMSRTGNAEYVCVFRKPGTNPEPISHTNDTYPVELWQRDASPVWMDVRQGNVLNGKAARAEQDERHICPLQLDVIERVIRLWSNPGDLVLSPFAGIASEGFQAIKMGRKFVGFELKESYWKEGQKYLEMAEAESGCDLFELVGQTKAQDDGPNFDEP